MELYQSLTQFRDSIIDPMFVRESDDDGVVEITKVNETNRGKSLVKMNFTEEEYMKIFIDDSNDYSNTSSIISACESSYGNLFVDTYWGDEEMKGGYVFHYFNEENLQILRNIFKLVNPSLANFAVANPEDAGDFFYRNFENSAGDIANEYTDYYDETLRKGCLEYVNKKLCGKFDNYGIVEKKCRSTYLTTVSLIINFWDKSDTPHDSTIIEMLQNFVKKNNLEFDEDLYEDYYNYFDNENWDGDSFNRQVNRTLENLYESITDDLDPEDLENIRKFHVMMTNTGISYNEWMVFPKEKTFGEKNENKIFKVRGFEEGKVTVFYKQDKNDYGSEQKMSIGVDDFMNFLYHPELF